MSSSRHPPAMTRLKGVRNPPPIRRRSAANLRTCPNPTCTEPKIEDDGDKRVCVSCGTVVSDSNIVSEVQFGETAAGAAVVQGSYVGADQSHARSSGGRFKRAGGMESREVAEANGKQYINRIAIGLDMPQSLIDTAVQIYKLAVIYNFVQGRTTKEVAAVALYMACRKQERNKYMLIDFSDILLVNVFRLGKIFKQFTKICKVAGFKPVIAENLIYRFATKLEFGSMTEKVAHDATRLVQRMDRDWMTTGRRPSGICGACLILAARMNNFRRTVREVVYIVKVTDMTINKRLEEFRVTPSSNLTVEQFRTIDLTSSHEPPAFYEQRDGKKKGKRKRAAEESETQQEEAAGDQPSPTQDSNTQTPIPSSLTPPTVPVRRDADGFAIPEVPIDPKLLAASAAALSEITPPSTSTTVSAPTPPSSSSTTVSTDESESPAKRPRGRPRKDGSLPPPGPSLTTPADLLVEAELESEISQLLMDPSTTEHLDAYTAYLASSRALAQHLAPDNPNISSSEIIDEAEFADDPEVRDCCLTSAEVAIKERIWVHENRDYLREQQRKLLKRELEDRLGTHRVIKRRNRKKRIGEGGGEEEEGNATSPGDAMGRVLRRRGFSKKINYGAIERAFEGAGSRLASREGSLVASRAGSVALSEGGSVGGAVEAGPAVATAGVVGGREAVGADAGGEDGDEEGDGDDDLEMADDGEDGDEDLEEVEEDDDEVMDDDEDVDVDGYFGGGG